MFNRSVPDERKADMVNAIPVRRIGQPRDIGDAVAFLVSDAAGFITGGNAAGHGWRGYPLYTALTPRRPARAAGFSGPAPGVPPATRWT